MAKILLIHPPWQLLLGGRLNEIPYGLCSLAGYLNRHGHESWVYNGDFDPGKLQFAGSSFSSYEEYKQELTQFKHPIWNKVRQYISTIQPDIVGIHCKTGAIESVKRVASIAKEVLPDCKVVAGGPHATLMPEETVKLENIDLVVIGEGEESLLDIANNYHKLYEKKIQGVLIKSLHGDIINGGSRPLIDNLDNLGVPDREYIIEKEHYSSYSFGIIMTARGCPYDCTYCASKGIWTKKVRYRSPESVVEEMEYVYHRYGTRYFNFRDDTFTLKRSRAMEICRLIRECVPGVSWRCDTRADSIDDELAKAMRKAGCVQANIGVESGSPRILEMIKKDETREEIEAGIRSLRKQNISVSAFVMIGFPSETVDDVRMTLDFTKSLKPDNMVASIMTPYPGTEIHREAKREGILPDDISFSDYFHQSPKMGLMDMDHKEFEKFAEDYFRQVDCYNNSLWRKTHRFLLIFTSNPLASLQRLKNYFWK